MNIREAAVHAVVAEGEFLMFNAEQVHHGGVDVIDLGGFAAVLGFVAPFIAETVGDTAADAAAAEPVGEDERIVIPALAALRARHAAELRGPENDGVFEHAALFEILDERSDGMGHAGGEWTVIPRDVFMAIPISPRETIVIS